MKILFLGIKACGKGTQAEILSGKLKLPHISSGDLFRSIDKKTQIGKKIRSYIDKGLYVPDDLVLKLVLKRLKEKDCRDGFILDGFPRTLPQAEHLAKIHSLDHIILIDISEKEAILRSTGRRVCSNTKCNISYNLYTAPKPKVIDKCDKCGSKLFQREDETEEASKRRIKKDIKEIKPLIKFYNKKIKRINGEQSIKKVHKDIKIALFSE